MTTLHRRYAVVLWQGRDLLVAMFCALLDQQYTLLSCCTVSLQAIALFVMQYRCVFTLSRFYCDLCPRAAALSRSLSKCPSLSLQVHVHCGMLSARSWYSREAFIGMIFEVGFLTPLFVLAIARVIQPQFQLRRALCRLACSASASQVPRKYLQVPRSAGIEQVQHC